MGYEIVSFVFLQVRSQEDLEFEAHSTTLLSAARFLLVRLLQVRSGFIHLCLIHELCMLCPVMHQYATHSMLL